MTFLLMSLLTSGTWLALKNHCVWVKITTTKQAVTQLFIPTTKIPCYVFFSFPFFLFIAEVLVNILKDLVLIFISQDGLSFVLDSTFFPL